ncbi:hypothetical protein [Nitrincola sp. A-D6]|uniref:hypothetical protein n=1 Tax=Nitrincola sp. A-D6 TaxID=1545442 RepID=UPI00055DD835|nr:hypothetical protein [Nitrincola sp. A-D6]
MNKSLLWCLLAFMSLTTLANERPDYRVIEPEGYEGGRFHARDVFEGRDWGDYDPEPMPEIYPSEPAEPLEPVVIMYSEPDEVFEIKELFNQPEEPQPLTGEDRIFSEITADIREQQCFALGLSQGCDPDVGFTGELTFETDTGQLVGEEMLGAGNFYRRLEALETEPEPEERFRLLEESFTPDLNVLFK